MSHIRTSKAIIIVGAVVLLLSTAVVGMLYVNGVLTQRDAQTATEATVPSQGTAYQADFREKQAKVAELVAAGGSVSIEEAKQIVQKEIEAAERSQNKGYIVDAKLAQASLQIVTGQPGDALQDLLILEQEYQGVEPQIYDIYAQISFAYKQLDQAEKSTEYLSKIPGTGWDD